MKAKYDKILDEFREDDFPEDLPKDVRWMKVGDVIKLQYYNGSAWVDTGTEFPI